MDMDRIPFHFSNVECERFSTFQVINTRALFPYRESRHHASTNYRMRKVNILNCIVWERLSSVDSILRSLHSIAAKIPGFPNHLSCRFSKPKTRKRPEVLVRNFFERCRNSITFLPLVFSLHLSPRNFQAYDTLFEEMKCYLRVYCAVWYVKQRFLHHVQLFIAIKVLYQINF